MLKNKVNLLKNNTKNIIKIKTIYLIKKYYYISINTNLRSIITLYKLFK